MITLDKKRTAAAAAAALLGLALAGCGGTSDRSTAIATEIGASQCTKTNYYIVIRTDHSKHTIYDCLRNGRDMCVTEDSGVAHDETALARILFKQNLNGGSPACAT